MNPIEGNHAAYAGSYIMEFIIAAVVLTAIIAIVMNVLDERSAAKVIVRRREL